MRSVGRREQYVYSTARLRSVFEVSTKRLNALAQSRHWSVCCLYGVSFLRLTRKIYAHPFIPAIYARARTARKSRSIHLANQPRNDYWISRTVTLISDRRCLLHLIAVTALPRVYFVHSMLQLRTNGRCECRPCSGICSDPPSFRTSESGLVAHGFFGDQDNTTGHYQRTSGLRSYYKGDTIHKVRDQV